MKFAIAASLLATAPTASAFVPSHKSTSLRLRVTAEDATVGTDRPIFDPMGLYPDTSEEKRQGRIRPLEPQMELERRTRDPMGLYPKESSEFMRELEEYQVSRVGTHDRAIFDPMGLYSTNSPERQEGRIQSMEPVVELTRNINDPMGLYPQDSDEFMESLRVERESIISNNRQLHDPLGLYPTSSVEYQEGQIKALEPEVNMVKPVLDPLRLYPPTQIDDEVDTDVVMSEALPFMAKPALLDGELVGDAGFDPLGLSKSREDLLWQRKAELKHSRIAMLAAVGWPISELLDKKLSTVMHMKPMVVEGDRVPSLLNGGLLQVNPFFWFGVLAMAGFVEVLDVMKVNDRVFDPLKLYPSDTEGQKRMQLAEIKNGRLAMMAVTTFVAIEAITRQAVVNTTPFLFHMAF